VDLFSFLARIEDPLTVRMNCVLSKVPVGEVSAEPLSIEDQPGGGIYCFLRGYAEQRGGRTYR